jgi:hypothetical protein
MRAQWVLLPKTAGSGHKFSRALVKPQEQPWGTFVLLEEPDAT